MRNVFQVQVQVSFRMSSSSQTSAQMLGMTG